MVSFIWDVMFLRYFLCDIYPEMLCLLYWFPQYVQIVMIALQSTRVTMSCQWDGLTNMEEEITPWLVVCDSHSNVHCTLYIVHCTLLYTVHQLVSREGGDTHMDTQWHTVTHMDIQWVTHMDIQWHTVTHSDIQWHTVTYSDTHGHTVSDTHGHKVTHWVTHCVTVCHCMSLCLYYVIKYSYCTIIWNNV